MDDDNKQGTTNAIDELLGASKTSTTTTNDLLGVVDAQPSSLLDIGGSVSSGYGSNYVKVPT